MSKDEKPYTTGEIASMSHVTINAVKKWISSGKLIAFRTPGGHFRINREDFRNFVEKYRFQIMEDVFPTKHKILIADDSPEIVELIKKALEIKYGAACQIESAGDGYEALIKVGSFRPDLLVLDIRMPRIDGIEACRRLRSDINFKGLKILAITAFGKEEMAKIKLAGADTCLPKPIEVESLLSMVSMLLGKESRRTAS